MVEVQKLRTFYDFCGARATLYENLRGRGSQTAFYDFCGARATLCGDSRGRGSKTGTFYDFCGARATLCGDSRGRGSKIEDFFTISSVRDSRGRGSKLRTFYDFCGARATLCGRGSKAEDFLLCGDRARRSALAVAPCEFVLVSAYLCGDCACRSALAAAPYFFLARETLWKLSRGLRACFRNPAVAGSIPPWSAAAPA